MPIIKSAKKRVRVSTRAAARNRQTKRALKTAMKAFGTKAGKNTHAAAQSAIDTAVKKGIIHKNKAARQKKRLATQLKASGSKPTAKTAIKKVVTKKPTATKTAIKKVAAKK